MTITPEQIEKALRSWEYETGDTLLRGLHAGWMDSGFDVDPEEAISALARHVVACLSTEPVRFEVRPDSETKVALW